MLQPVVVGPEPDVYRVATAPEPRRVVRDRQFLPLEEGHPRGGEGWWPRRRGRPLAGAGRRRADEEKGG